MMIAQIGGSGSEKKNKKTNALLSVINNKLDIDKLYLYAKYPYEAKYQFLINKRESMGLKLFYGYKNFIEYSNGMQDVCKNIEEHNKGKKSKTIIVFGDIIADMFNKEN